MKKYYLIIFILLQLICHGCKSGNSSITNSYFEVTAPDESGIPDSIKNLYYTDAARLSVRYLYTFKSPDTLSVEIPKTLLDMFYRGLIHIYNARDISEVEYITRRNPIHTSHSPDVNTLTVAVDTSFSWTKAWQNGDIITYNNNLNDLLTPYNFRVSKFISITNYHLAVLTTEKPINLFALANEIEKIEGVLHANPEGYGGDGNYIEATVNLNYIEFIFSIGWNDCPAGCIERHFWKYRVNSFGHVEFIKEYGNPLEEYDIYSVSIN